MPKKSSFALESFLGFCYNTAIKTTQRPRRGKEEIMTDSRNYRDEHESRDADRRTEETRVRIKDKLYKAKAAGQLDDDDEDLILQYALGVVTRRGKHTQE